MTETDILIVGGGLSGLALADHLHRAEADFALLEARNRFGGRIKVLESDGVGVDLGPSWFWPGQPRIAGLAERFGLTIFEQYAKGALSYENERGEVLRDQGWASMQGSLRIQGGMSKLIDALYRVLPSQQMVLNCKITKLVRAGEVTKVLDENGVVVARAKRVVLTLPPRLASCMEFEPALPDASVAAMRNIPTWMAGHAKFVAIYDRPFWREAGLSGDAMSRHGPMMEIHDAGDPSFESGALFGFLGVPAVVRLDHRTEIIDACISQLERIFGPAASQPINVYLQDWADEKETAIQLDHEPPAGHPAYGLPTQLTALWNEQLVFGSTEIASQFGGFLEGALEAAESTARLLIGEA